MSVDDVLLDVAGQSVAKDRVNTVRLSTCRTMCDVKSVAVGWARWKPEWVGIGHEPCSVFFTQGGRFPLTLRRLGESKTVDSLIRCERRGVYCPRVLLRNDTKQCQTAGLPGGLCGDWYVLVRPTMVLPPIKRVFSRDGMHYPGGEHRDHTRNGADSCDAI
jgi:hypothetical protein